MVNVFEFITVRCAAHLDLLGLPLIGNMNLMSSTLLPIGKAMFLIIIQRVNARIKKSCIYLWIQTRKFRCNFFNAVTKVIKITNSNALTKVAIILDFIHSGDEVLHGPSYKCQSAQKVVRISYSYLLWDMFLLACMTFWIRCSFFLTIQVIQINQISIPHEKQLVFVLGLVTRMHP